MKNPDTGSLSGASNLFSGLIRIRRIARAFALLRKHRRESWRPEYEQAFGCLLQAGRLEECGSCGYYHPRRIADRIADPRSDYYGGDCHDDNNRF